VVIKRRPLPSGAVSWRAVYEDPDTGRDTYVTLEPLVCSTAEGRRRWGITKARALAKRRDAIQSGAPRSEAKELADVAAKHGLPPEQQEAVILHAVEGFTFREIGGILGIPADTASSRYRYALEKLRERLSP